MQLVIALPLFAAKSPANILFVAEIINAIINLDFIDKKVLYDKFGAPIFGEIEDTETEESTSVDEANEEDQSTKDYFKGSNFIANVLFLAMVLLIVGLLISLIVIVDKCLLTKCCGWY